MGLLLDWGLLTLLGSVRRARTPPIPPFGRLALHLDPVSRNEVLIVGRDADVDGKWHGGFERARPTGEVHWHATTAHERIHSAVVTPERVVVLGFGGVHALVAFDRETGVLAWARAAPITPGLADVVVDGETLVAWQICPGQELRVEAYDAFDGQRRWSKSMPGRNSFIRCMVLSPGRLLLRGRGESVEVDARTGEQLRTLPEIGGLETERGILASDPQATWIPRDGGTPRALTSCNHPEWCADRDGDLVVFERGGLRRYDLATGRPRWTIDLAVVDHRGPRMTGEAPRWIVFIGRGDKRSSLRLWVDLDEGRVVSRTPTPRQTFVDVDRGRQVAMHGVKRNVRRVEALHPETGAPQRVTEIRIGGDQVSERLQYGRFWIAGTAIVSATRPGLRAPLPWAAFDPFTGDVASTTGDVDVRPTR